MEANYRRKTELDQPPADLDRPSLCYEPRDMSYGETLAVCVCINLNYPSPPPCIIVCVCMQTNVCVHECVYAQS